MYSSPHHCETVTPASTVFKGIARWSFNKQVCIHCAPAADAAQTLRPAASLATSFLPVPWVGLVLPEVYETRGLFESTHFPVPTLVPLPCPLEQQAYLHVGRGLLRARQEVRTTHPWEPFGEATISLVHFKSVAINSPLPSPSILSIPPVVETLNLVSHVLSKCPTLSCIPSPLFFSPF